MNPSYFLIAAYAVVWTVLLFYILTLNIRLNVIRKEMESFKKK